jgi:hypothetical protein
MNSSVLRAGALIVLLAGAIGSFAFMLRVGSHNPSRILMIVFSVWVLAPFAALIFSMRWAAFSRPPLYIVVLVMALGSAAIYGYVAYGPSRAQPAFAFLVVPFVSWLLIAMALFISKLRQSRS